MREAIYIVWRSRFIAATLGLAALLAAAAAIMPYVILKSVPVPLIVHFTETTGIDRVGSLWEVVSAGVLAMVMVIINSLVAVELERRRLFWAKFLSLATLALAALIFIGVLAIISVN